MSMKPTKSIKSTIPCVQAAGHQATLLQETDEDDYVLKPYEEVEVRNYEKLWSPSVDDADEPMRRFVSRFDGVVTEDATPTSKIGRKFMRLGNLLRGFTRPCVLDCKLGVRTFQESEASKEGTPRADLFQKMLKLDPNALSEEDKARGSITKLKWMTWRDDQSTTTSLGFRIDGVASQDSVRLKMEDLSRLRTREEALPVLQLLFPPRIPGDPDGTLRQRVALTRQVIAKLQLIRSALSESPFFNSHEFIGASLLFVMDRHHVEVFLIDFAKTARVPDGIAINHTSAWQLGNHEDGVLLGVEMIEDAWLHILLTLDQWTPEQLLAKPTAVGGHSTELDMLEARLRNAGVDVGCFGHNGARSLEELFWEVTLAQASTLESDGKGGIVRAVSIVRAWILVASPEGYMAFMGRFPCHTQMRALSGLNSIPSRQYKLRPLARKMLVDHCWRETLASAINERLGYRPEDQSRLFKVDTTSYAMHVEEAVGRADGDSGYPGLRTSYKVHEVDVWINNINDDALATIGLPNMVDVATMELGNEHASGFAKAMGSALHLWTWTPVADTKYNISLSQRRQLSPPTKGVEGADERCSWSLCFFGCDAWFRKMSS